MKDERMSVEAWHDQYLDYLAGDRSDVPSLDDLDPAERSRARRLAFTTSELWGRHAGPRSDEPSPVAEALGFTHIDANVAIAGAKLKAARKASKLTVSGLSRRLRELGWAVSAAELGELETGKRLEIPGEVFPLLAVLLDVSADQLMTTGAVRVDTLLRVDSVRSVLEEGAKRLGRSVDEIIAVVRPQLAAAHYRERDSQVDDLVAIVEAIVEAIE